MDQSAIVGAIALGGLAIYGYARMFMSGKSTDRLKEILPLATVVDVRTNQEYRESHLNGARNIPVDRIAKSKSKFGNPDEPVVLYCASGSRARQAARILRSMGFSSVHVGGSLARMKKLTTA